MTYDPINQTDICPSVRSHAELPESGPDTVILIVSNLETFAVSCW